VREGFEPSVVIQRLGDLLYEGRKNSNDLFDGPDVVGYVVGRDGLLTPPAGLQELDRMFC
jgi:hypothetical protein